MSNKVKETGEVLQYDEQIERAFSDLMGLNGDSFKREIYNTGVLSKSSYDIITDNVYFNGKSSLAEHFGLIHWYYIQGLRRVEAITNKF